MYEQITTKYSDKALRAKQYLDTSLIAHRVKSFVEEKITEIDTYIIIQTHAMNITVIEHVEEFGYEFIYVLPVDKDTVELTFREK